MKTRWIALCLGTFLLVPAIWSQVNSPAQASKIGTISFQAAVVGTAEGKQASSEIQTQFAARSNELQTLQKQIEDLRAKLQAGSTAASAAEQQKIEREGERLTHLLQRKQQYFQEDLNTAQQDVANGIGRKLVDVLNKYAKEHSYAVILDTSAQQTPVAYAVPEIDVTQEVMRLYDQTYPAKSATPKPAATPTP